jgi:RND family efflux transporter MFP subunit
MTACVRATALALCALAACGGQKAPTPAARASRPAGGVAVDTATLRVPLSLPAQLYTERDVIVAARSNGTIQRLLVDLGAPVRAGQLLAQIESADQEIALARAEAGFANAEQLVSRARAIRKAGGVTVADSEQVELQYTQAALALREARRNLELTRVVAPFTGVVTARYARPWRLAASGDSLFRVTETAPLLARVRVPEASADGIRAGDAATVVGTRGASAPARVLRVSPAIDAGSGTREVVVQLANAGADGASALLPGASVVVRLGAERRRVTTVPRDVVDGGYALVADGDRTTLRAVTLGADLGDGRVEVVSGLAPGERILRPEH